MSEDKRITMPRDVRYGVQELTDFPTLLTWGFVLTAAGSALAWFFLSTAEVTTRGIDLSVWFWISTFAALIGVVVTAVGVNRLLWGLHRAMAEIIYRRAAPDPLRPRR